MKEYAGCPSRISVDSCRTVSDVVDALDVRYPGVSRRILDDQDRVRRYVNVFLNGEMVEVPLKEALVRDGDEVYIIQSVAGG